MVGDVKGGVIALHPRRSLGFLLLSIALWFIGYNAVETWFTTYASQVWGMALGESSVCLTIAMAGAIASYVPVGAWRGASAARTPSCWERPC